ncbi:MAG: hypothetical protein P8M77_09930 [Porticoccaceae bacterium]|nr:hypothetical protein [Porticoccaceae bacterium]
MKKIFIVLLLAFSTLSYALDIEVLPTAAEVTESQAIGLVARVDFEQAD